MNIPNAISLTRLFLCGALFFLTKEPIWFLAGYLLCGLSDMADGYLARKLNAESTLGARLDTLGDAALYLLIIFVFATQTTIFSKAIILVLLLTIIAVRLMNLFLTRYKFGLWGVMHTVASKTVGVLIYLSLPLYYLCDNLPVWLAVIICGLALLAALEETFMIATAKEYDINRKGLLR